MRRFLRLLPFVFLSLSLVLAVGIVALSRARSAHRPPAEDFDLGPVQDFSLTERGGGTVTRGDLHGKVWVAAFIFTRCRSTCPQITATLARLQKALPDRPDVRIVAFDVDPDHDTPAVLRRYADTYQADPQRWLFLTGDRKQIYGLIENSFHLAVQETEGDARRAGNEVIHSSRLAVVDRRGHIRGFFDGRQLDDADQPVNDVPRLVERVNDLLREGS